MQVLRAHPSRREALAFLQRYDNDDRGRVNATSTTIRATTSTTTTTTSKSIPVALVKLCVPMTRDGDDYGDHPTSHSNTYGVVAQSLQHLVRLGVRPILVLDHRHDDDKSWSSLLWSSPSPSPPPPPPSPPSPPSPSSWWTDPRAQRGMRARGRSELARCVDQLAASGLMARPMDLLVVDGPRITCTDPHLLRLGLGLLDRDRDHPLNHDHHPHGPTSGRNTTSTTTWTRTRTTTTIPVLLSQAYDASTTTFVPITGNDAFLAVVRVLAAAEQEEEHQLQQQKLASSSSSSSSSHKEEETEKEESSTSTGHHSHDHQHQPLRLSLRKLAFLRPEGGFVGADRQPLRFINMADEYQRIVRSDHGYGDDDGDGYDAGDHRRVLQLRRHQQRADLSALNDALAVSSPMVSAIVTKPECAYQLVHHLITDKPPSSAPFASSHHAAAVRAPTPPLLRAPPRSPLAPPPALRSPLRSPPPAALKTLRRRGESCHATILRQGIPIRWHYNLDRVGTKRLNALMEASFGKSMDDRYWDRLLNRSDCGGGGDGGGGGSKLDPLANPGPPRKELPLAAIVIAGDYQGAAVLTRDVPNTTAATATTTTSAAEATLSSGQLDVVYLDKFAVSPQSQGMGVADILWTEMRDKYDMVWRSRVENGVNKWYACGSLFVGDWWFYFAHHARIPCTPLPLPLPTPPLPHTPPHLTKPYIIGTLNARMATCGWDGGFCSGRVPRASSMWRPTGSAWNPYRQRSSRPFGDACRSSCAWDGTGLCICMRVCVCVSAPSFRGCWCHPCVP